MPVRSVLPELTNTILKVEEEPAFTITGLKLLTMLIDGGPGWITIKEAVAGLALVTVPPPPLAVKLLIVLVTVMVVALTPVILTVTVHEPGVEPVWAGTVPPAKEMVDVPATAVTVPPQLLTIVGLLATVIGTGKLSVQEALVKAKAFGLTMVTVRSLV
jgi:hypothetical protein